MTDFVDRNSNIQSGDKKKTVEGGPIPMGKFVLILKDEYQPYRQAGN
jgi:hypothetical protein